LHIVQKLSFIKSAPVFTAYIKNIIVNKIETKSSVTFALMFKYSNLIIIYQDKSVNKKFISFCHP
jgi:hypothetical protein